MKILFEKNDWAIGVDQDSEWQKVFAVNAYGVYNFKRELKLLGYSGWNPIGQKKTFDECVTSLIEKGVLTKEEADELVVLQSNKNKQENII